MLLRNFDLLFNDPTLFFVLLLLIAIALLVGITVHEFSHALIADRLGDPTARRLGRLSLNPMAHLDPVGTLMLVLAGFGWGKPVPVNGYNLQNGRRSMALVAIAGPISNILAAFLFAIPIRLGIVQVTNTYILNASTPEILGTVFVYIIFYNVVLAVFNLIPIPPLDGSNVLLGVLPEDAARSYTRFAPYGPPVLFLVIMLDYFFNLGLLAHIINPAVNLIGSLAIR